MEKLNDKQKKYLVEKYFVDTVRSRDLDGADNIGMKLIEEGTCIIPGDENYWEHLGVTSEVDKEFIGCIRLNLKLEDLLECATFKQYHKDYLMHYNQEVVKIKRQLTEEIHRHTSLMDLRVA